MDNPETQTTLDTQDTGRKDKQNKNTKQKTKKMSNTDPPPKIEVEPRCWRRVSSSCLI